MAEAVPCNTCGEMHNPYRGCYPPEDAQQARVLLAAADDGLVALVCNCGGTAADHKYGVGASFVYDCPLFRWVGADDARAAALEQGNPHAFDQEDAADD